MIPVWALILFVNIFNLLNKMKTKLNWKDKLKIIIKYLNTRAYTMLCYTSNFKLLTFKYAYYIAYNMVNLHVRK